MCINSSIKTGVSLILFLWLVQKKSVCVSVFHALQQSLKCGLELSEFSGWAFRKTLMMLDSGAQESSSDDFVYIVFPFPKH